MRSNKTEQNLKKHHAWAFACVFFTIFAFVFVSSTPIHANFFIKPGQKQEKKSNSGGFWSKIWLKQKQEDTTPKAKVTADPQKYAKRRAKKLTNAPKSSIRFDGFEVYHAAKNIDPALLYSSGRNPQNSAELQLVSAAHNTAKVAQALASRRKIRERVALTKQKRERLQMRRALATKQRNTQTKRRASSTARALPDRKRVYTTPNRTKPSKVFTDF